MMIAFCVLESFDTRDPDTKINESFFARHASTIIPHCP